MRFVPYVPPVLLIVIALVVNLTASPKQAAARSNDHVREITLTAAPAAHHHAPTH